MPDAKLITHRATLASPERRTHNGREYLVVPVVAIRQGVLNGELVPADEIGRYVEAWQGRPIPLGHPTDRGVPVSANTPDLEAQTPGRFWNATFSDGALKGEIWLDVLKCQELGGDALRALEQLEAGVPTEVSTAYWRDLEETSGVYQGKPYYGIARNLRPDHLALLLDEIGACSWRDGCGAPRVNQRGTMRKLTVNQTQTGVMVALYPDEETARALALDAGDLPDGSRVIPWEELHLTLAFFGPIEKQYADQPTALRELADVAAYMPIVRGTVGGVGRFRGEEEDAFVLLYDSPGLDDVAETVREIMSYYDLYASRKHGFTPHITLGYIPTDAETPGIVPDARDIPLTSIGLAWGESVTLFDLQGEVRAVETNQERTGGLWGIVRNVFRSIAGQKQQKQEEDEKMGQQDKQPAANSGCNQPPATNAEQGPNTQQPEPTPTVDVEAIAANAAKQAAEEAAKQAVEAAFEPFGGIEAVKEAVDAFKANRDAERAELVEAITANSDLAEADLAGMDLNALRKLAGTFNRPAPDYSGRGGPRANRGNDEEELPMPALFTNGNGTGN